MHEIVVEQKQQGYRIQVEYEQNIIHSKLYGFFTYELERQYCEDFFRMLDTMTTSGRSVLVDTTEYPPQSKEVQTIRQELIQQLSTYNVSKIAYIVTHALSRLQSERLNKTSSSVQVAYFESENKAREWLMTSSPEIQLND